jgi:hypothetical protein
VPSQLHWQRLVERCSAAPLKAVGVVLLPRALLLLLMPAKGLCEQALVPQQEVHMRPASALKLNLDEHVDGCGVRRQLQKRRQRAENAVWRIVVRGNRKRYRQPFLKQVKQQ